MEDQNGGKTEGVSPSGRTVSTASTPHLSGLAVASLVLGILGLCTMIPAPIAVILGIVALIKISKHPTELHGSALAISGIVISGFTLLMAPMMIAILFPVFAKARERADEGNCLSHLKCISLSMKAYTMDYDGHLPPLSGWNAAATFFHASPDQLICPSTKGHQPSYAINARLKHISLDSVKSPECTALLFDSVPGTNKSGGSEIFPSPLRHLGGECVVYTDGHAKWVKSLQIPSINWDPSHYVSPKSSGIEEDGATPAAGSGDQ